ncbi:MAG: hypothetical protein KC933_29240 [Myxococcales bacterium]|nr:hypothetical protein [Myxococcales bacterium]
MQNAARITAFAAALALPALAAAQDVCEDVSRPLTGQRLLRRISLDLRDSVPSGVEVEAQRDEESVGEAVLEQYLASEEFVGVMRRYHEALLWPNIDQIQIVPDTHMLYPLEFTPGDPVYVSPVRAVFVRAVGNGNIFVPCKNEPAEFDALGNLVLEPVVVGTTTVSWVEGYVEVEPYWAPGTSVKVCGLDALPNVTGALCPGPADRYPFLEGYCSQFDAYAAAVQAPFRDAQVSCDSALAIFAPECACGPNLRYCMTPETGAQIRASLLDQMLRVVERTVAQNRPYHEVLTTKTVEFNGPVVHFLKYMSNLSFDISGGVDATAPPPDLEYSQVDTWVPVERTGRHSGVLTTPGYLLKHQSGRQRAHRFYNAFECSSFIPAGPLPSPFEPCSQHEDLTQRCGCDGCHKTLEPLAAHWGRFSEYGFTHLDEATYPSRVGANCAPPLSSVLQLFKCYRYYELEPVGEEQAYAGMLNAYVFRTPEEVENIEVGPSKLAQDSLQSGRFAQCTVRRLWSHFMRREPTLDEAAEVIPDLAAVFEASDHDLKALVKTIVSHPAYRRMP